MREIKFRAWDKKAKVMRRVTQIDFWDGLVFWVNKLRILREVKENRENVELMQYTGLKDKNGVEIYEGDFLKYRPAFWDGPEKPEHITKDDYKTKKVEYIQGGFHIDGIPLGRLIKAVEMNVIGNVYENPEFLEAKK
ncbi:YopX family protein [uncultured Enterococcus sp.]|uniref:YopX family protein n=1 Tax=uncultured Enterococcus sp. TaxID=167972 RepID=UPI002AA78493|nr:YopX family protein [uncultured Enterococcus sp.]